MSNPKTLEESLTPTIDTPHGEMEIVGTSQHSGNIILGNDKSLVEATPEELDAWHAEDSHDEHSREMEIIEGTGKLVVEKSVASPDARAPEDEPDGGEHEPEPGELDDPDADTPVPEVEAEDEGPPDEPPEEPPHDPDDGEDDPGDGEEDDDDADDDDDDADDGGLPILPPEMIIAAGLAHLRLETVQKAFDAGFEDPVAYLSRSRRSPEMVKRMQSRGWDMRPPDENESRVPEDPVIAIGDRGNRRRDEVTEIVRMIESETGRQELLDQLASPANLSPLHIIPFGHKLALRHVAWRIYRRERSKRPATKEFTMPNTTKEVRPVIYDDGRFGLGFTHVRHIMDYLESLDKDIKVQRSKISPANLHEIMGDLISKRRDVANKISRDLRALAKVRVYKYEPLGLYEHAPFKKALKDYDDRKDSLKEAQERNDFVRIRFLGARTLEEQARFDELAEKHPNWL